MKRLEKEIRKDMGEIVRYAEVTPSNVAFTGLLGRSIVFAGIRLMPSALAMRVITPTSLIRIQPSGGSYGKTGKKRMASLLDRATRLQNFRVTT